MNNDWILIADDLRDLASLGAPFRMMTTRDYVLQPKLLSGARPKIINLARSYNYQTDGYYASLLAEARGDRRRGVELDGVSGGLVGLCHAG